MAFGTPEELCLPSYTGKIAKGDGEEKKQVKLSRNIMIGHIKVCINCFYNLKKNKDLINRL
jgi:hypothetical protein